VVLSEPEDLDRAELEAIVKRHWGLRGATLEYLPVGFGSHHWTAEDSRGARWFVSVDDLEAGFQAGPDADAAFAALERAFRTAVALRDEARLDFVVAPLSDDEGLVVRRVSDRYAVRLSPLVEGASSAAGSYESPDDRRLMGDVLGRLHAATAQISTDLPRKEDFALPSRAALVEALHDLDRPWSSGPFGEPARRLLEAGAHDVERDLREYDVLAARVREHSDAWVVTHGEPHRANVIRDPLGGVHLVDWDTTLLAPRERDLRMVLDRELTGWDEYVAVAGAACLHQEAIELYLRWWDLAEIGIYIEGFRHPHQRTEDTIKSWESLAEYCRGSDRDARKWADQ
jgi:spectinomycin phosphotransferase